MKNLFKHIKISNKKLLLVFFAYLFAFFIIPDFAYAQQTQKKGAWKDQIGKTSNQLQTEANTTVLKNKDTEQKGCDSPEKVRQRFLTKCFICDVVISLTREFVQISKKAYVLISDTAYRILIIMTLLWIPFYIIKQVSSFVAIEPASMAKDLSVQLFKIFIAYTAIFIGIETLINILISPFLMFGLDFGEGILSTQIDANKIAEINELAQKNAQFYIFDDSVMPKDLVVGMLRFLSYLNHAMTNHLVIGNSLMCYASGPGALEIIGVKFIDIWIFLSGLIIYIFGVCLLIAAGYYFLDVSYRIGFVVMFMPIFIALWPFNITKKHMSKALSVIFTAAAVFAFFAIVISLSISLVDVSLGKLSPILEMIKTDQGDAIKEQFEGTSIWFVYLLFCIILSFQIIGHSKSFANDFFGDSLFGSGGTANDHMHNKLTQMTGKAASIAKMPASYVGDVAKTQGKKGLKAAGKGIAQSSKSMGTAVNKGITAGGKGTGAAAGAAIGGLVGGILGIVGGPAGMAAGAKAGAKSGAKIGGKAGKIVGSAVGKVAGKTVETGANVSGKAIEGSTKMIGDVKKVKKDKG